MTTETRELQRDEFYLAENLWEQYHGQKADPEHEKTFGVFVDGDLVASARYVKHVDGVEIDCVFVPEPEGKKGVCPGCRGGTDKMVWFRADLHPFNP